ncbi:MAG: hypothetical protein IH845_05630 [Nanoarchaeota archaeon]|nr:hypothetical protein [Nanoarchaeota archaeon]
MDYGGNERRRTKKDLKRKRLARGYKRGGQFRTQAVNETSTSSDVDSKTKKKGYKNPKKKRY